MWFVKIAIRIMFPEYFCILSINFEILMGVKEKEKGLKRRGEEIKVTTTWKEGHHMVFGPAKKWWDSLTT